MCFGGCACEHYPCLLPQGHSGVEERVVQDVGANRILVSWF